MEYLKNFESNSAWNAPRSYIKSEQDEKGRLIIFGVEFYHGVEFRFRLTQQTNVGAAMRGSVSVNDTDGYHIMQISGSKKVEILKQIEEKRPDYLRKMEGKRIPELNMTISVYCNSLDIETIKERVNDAVLRLNKEYANQIHHAYGAVVRPDTITPGLAAQKHVDSFLKKNHAGLSEKSFKSYREEILLMCMELPYIPMANFKQSMIQSYFKAKNLGQHKKDLLRNFWEYCRQAKVCTGNLPFPPKEKKKISTSKATRDATRPDDLSLTEQDKLFDLISVDPTGGDAGIALQLWGGYSAKDSCTINWGDIIWDENHLDYVRVRYFIHDLVGATHNYTAPLFPAGAKILHTRYQKLRERYSEKELTKMPIVSQIKNPAKAMTPDALVQHATMRLHSIGLSYRELDTLRKFNPDMAISRLLLTNTYAKNVNVSCSLQDEEGTAKFLMHEPLSSNTTDDHYTCFSDDEAGERLHTIMSCVIPAEMIEIGCEPTELLSGGREQHTFTPDTTRQRVGHVGQYTLNPGEEIIIKAPHGITGSAIVRGINKDGSLRRKTKKSSPA